MKIKPGNYISGLNVEANKFNWKYSSRVFRRIVALVVIATLALQVTRGQACWPTFRGDPQFSGTAAASLPQEPVLLWNFKTDNAIKASPVVCDGIIVIGSVDGNLYGLTLDGKFKWKINTGNGIEAPAMIHNGVAYVGNLEGKLLAVEIKTGRTLWEYLTDGQIMGAPNLWAKDKTEIIIVGSYDYFLHGIDAKTGKGLWKYETNNFLNGAPAISNGIAVFGGCDGLLHQVRVADGTLKSRQSVATYVAGSVAVDGNVTFVGDYDGRFNALNLQDGSVLWTFANEQSQQPFIAAPSLSAKKVFIANRDKYVYCFDKKSGKLLWKKNTGAGIDASTVLVGKQIVVANMRGDLMIMNEADGSIQWRYELGSQVTGNPAVIDDYIIVGASDGRLYCFGKK